MTQLRRVVGSAVVGAMVLVSGIASAQNPPTAAPAETDQTKLDEARQRYERGLQLYNESNFDAARVEFERAYQLAPSYKILYNIGLSYEQLGDYVQAQSTLVRYLEAGGAEISAERRAEVKKELAQIQPRIAKVTVQTNVPGSELMVDDQCSADANTGKVNCGALDNGTRVVLMNPGRRRVTVKKDGYLPQTEVLTVAGSDQVAVNVNLKSLPKYTEKKKNPWLLPTIIGWSVTGAGTIMWVVGSLEAKSASEDQKTALNKFPTNRSTLNSAHDKMKTWDHVADGFLIGSAVAAGVSTYLTIRAVTWKGEASNVNVEVGLGRAGVSGQF
jgi:tetratricopeptide (TPR) repeat protein